MIVTGGDGGAFPRLQPASAPLSLALYSQRGRLHCIAEVGDAEADKTNFFGSKRKGKERDVVASEKKNPG